MLSTIVEECQLDRWVCEVNKTIAEESRGTEEDNEGTEEDDLAGELIGEDLGPAWDYVDEKTLDPKEVKRARGKK